MIRIAKANELEVIYNMWKEYFAHDDFGTIDYFFEYTMDINNLYVLVENNVIISSLYLNCRNIMIDNMQYKVGFISGVLTLKEYRHKGYMDKIFRHIFDNKLYDIYLLQAYNPQVYIKYGFKHLYTYKKYRLDNLQLSSSFTENYEIEELVNIYNEAMSNCNGYVIRDIAYFQDMIKELKIVSSKILYSKLYNSYVIVDSNNDINEIMLQHNHDLSAIFEKGNGYINISVNPTYDYRNEPFELHYDVLIKSNEIDFNVVNNLYMNEYY